MINNEGVILDLNKEDFPVPRDQNVFQYLDRRNKIYLKAAMRDAPETPLQVIQLKVCHMDRTTYCHCFIIRREEYFLIHGWKLQDTRPDNLSQYRDIAL